MTRRLFSKLRRKHGEDTKSDALVERQRVALAELGKRVRELHEGTRGLLQIFYSGPFVASKQAFKNKFHLRSRDQRPYVVVIGAGFAGLACAYELIQSQQYNVIVVDGKDRVGGRVWTVKQNNFKKTINHAFHLYKTVERGGELVGLNHFLWLHYADEFGLHLDSLQKDEDSDDEEEKNADGLPPSKVLLQYMNLIARELDIEAENLDLYGPDGADVNAPKPWDIPDAARLDGMSLEEYLDGLRDKYRNITLEEVKAIPKVDFKLEKYDFADFEKALEATKADFENNNGAPCSEQSLLFNLITIGNGNRDLDPVLFAEITDNVPALKDEDCGRRLSFWDDAERYRCKEGNMALALKFRDRILDAGSQIVLNSVVTQVAIDGDNVKIIVDKNGVSSPLQVPGPISKVVLATAPSVWNRIKVSPPLPNVKPAMGYLVKYLFNVKPSVTENFRKLASSTHTQWGMVWEAAMNQIPDGASWRTVNTLAVFAGGSHAAYFSNPPKSEQLGSDLALRTYICDNLNMMKPPELKFTFTPDCIEEDVFMDWPKDALIEGGYSCPAMNEVVNIGPQIHGEINGKIHLAGEYACRYKWCGFMEGALISGLGVAKDILKDSLVEISHSR